MSVAIVLCTKRADILNSRQIHIERAEIANDNMMSDVLYCLI